VAGKYRCLQNCSVQRLDTLGRALIYPSWRPFNGMGAWRGSVKLSQQANRDPPAHWPPNQRHNSKPVSKLPSPDQSNQFNPSHKVVGDEGCHTASFLVHSQRDTFPREHDPPPPALQLLFHRRLQRLGLIKAVDETALPQREQPSNTTRLTTIRRQKVDARTHSAKQPRTTAAIVQSYS